MTEVIENVKEVLDREKFRMQIFNMLRKADELGIAVSCAGDLISLFDSIGDEDDLELSHCQQMLSTAEENKKKDPGEKYEAEKLYVIVGQDEKFTKTELIEKLKTNGKGIAGALKDGRAIVREGKEYFIDEAI